VPTAIAVLSTIERVRNHNLLTNTTLRQFTSCFAGEDDDYVYICGLESIAPQDWADAVVAFGFDPDDDAEFDFTVHKGYDVFILTKKDGPLV
jgi:hypothetical protein